MCVLSPEIDHSGVWVPVKGAIMLLWVKNDDSLNRRVHRDGGELADLQTAMAGKRLNPAEIRSNDSVNGMSSCLRLSVGSQCQT